MSQSPDRTIAEPGGVDAWTDAVGKLLIMIAEPEREAVMLRTLDDIMLTLDEQTITRLTDQNQGRLDLDNLD